MCHHNGQEVILEEEALISRDILLEAQSAHPCPPSPMNTPGL